jgi:hypothetical protein
MIMMRSLPRYLILLLACLASTDVFSEEDCSWDGCKWEGYWERGAIYGGGAIAFFDSDVRLGFRSVNTVIDLEDGLGLDESSSSFRVGAYYRLGRRHRFDIEYYQYNRDATRRLSAGINIKDQIIGVDEPVSSKFDLNVIKADYQFNAWKTDTLELGLMVGIYGANIETRIEAPNLPLSEASDDLLPMPLFGIRITNALTDKLTVSTSYQYFAATIDDWSGGMQEVWFGLDYKVWERLGFGVSYDIITAHLENKDRSGFNGKVNLDYNSVFFYGKLFF